MSLMFKNNGKIRVAGLVVLLFLIGLFGMTAPGTAKAKTLSSDPATSLSIVLTDNETSTEIANYTIDQLKSMPQVKREYSSIDRMPAPVFTAGEGIDLANLLSNQGIDLSSITYIRFYATDGVVKKVDKAFLLDQTGYYYPKIVECWDCWDQNNWKYSDETRAKAGATEVKPMLSITSSQGRFLTAPDWSSLDQSACLRLCLGQTNPEDCITMNFVKWIYKIEVFGKSRSGGGSSAITAQISLDTPTTSASYQTGDKVKIGGTITNATSALKLTITDPDGNAVYTVFDLDIKDSKFNEEFTPEPDAVPGTYTITIGPASGSSAFCTRTFAIGKGAGSAASVTLNTPQAGSAFHPGDKVTISGTVSSVNSLNLKITGPDRQTVFTDNIDKNGDFSKEFDLAKDAAAGDYSIQITGTELKQACTGSFMVKSTNAPLKNNEKNAEEEKTQDVTQPGISGGLTDIADHWAADKINSLISRGDIKGYPDGTFKPDTSISRAEFTTAVVKAFALTNTNDKSFADTAGHWAKDYIATAVAQGIVSGYDDSTFGPDDPITREQMAAIVVKAAHLAPVTSSVDNFNDGSSIAQWARDSVATAVANQMINGYPDSTFRPDGQATRAEAVTLIVNALNHKNN